MIYKLIEYCKKYFYDDKKLLIMTKNYFVFVIAKQRVKTVFNNEFI